MVASASFGASGCRGARVSGPFSGSLQATSASTQRSEAEPTFHCHMAQEASMARSTPNRVHLPGEVFWGIVSAASNHSAPGSCEPATTRSPQKPGLAVQSVRCRVVTHNPEVSGSNPDPAIQKAPERVPFAFWRYRLRIRARNPWCASALRKIDTMGCVSRMPAGCLWQP